MSTRVYMRSPATQFEIIIAALPAICRQIVQLQRMRCQCLRLGLGPSIWESVTCASHLFNCEAYGKYVSLLGGEIILGYDFKTFTQFKASSFE